MWIQSFIKPENIKNHDCNMKRQKYMKTRKRNKKSKELLLVFMLHFVQFSRCRQCLLYCITTAVYVPIYYANTPVHI